MPRRGPGAWAPALLAIVPAAFTAALVARSGLDLPLLDDWDLVPLLLAAREGTLGPGEFWAQHNEHRLVVPRALMLGLALASDFDPRVQQAGSWLFAASLLALWLRQARASARALGLAPSPWFAPAASLLVFSFAQWQNWLWGWQIQIFMSLLAGGAGLALLAAPLGWGRIAAAAALGVVATLSFGTGFAYWPAGALLLALRDPRDRVGAGARLAAWVLFAGLLAAVYASGYQSPARHGSPLASLGRPLGLAAYALAFLGGPVAPFAGLPAFPELTAPWPVLPVAMVAGLLGGLGAAGVASWLARDAPPDARRPLVFWVAVAVQALGAALLCGVGRSGAFGAIQGLESRYLTVASPLWVALVALLVLAAGRRRRGAATAWAAVAAVAALAAGSSLVASRLGPRWLERYEPARARLLARDPSVLPLLAPDHPPELIAERARTLERLRLSVFRERRAP
jgi:hypothetical protein